MLAKWLPFKHSILAFCGDSNIILQQKRIDEVKKKEQRLTLNMVRAVNSISASRRKHTVQTSDIGNICNVIHEDALQNKMKNKNIKFRQQDDEPMVQLEDTSDTDADFDKNYDGFYDDADEDDDDEFSKSVTIEGNNHCHVITPITPITPMTPEKNSGFYGPAKVKMPGLKMIASEFSEEWSTQDLAFLDDEKADTLDSCRSKGSLSSVTPRYGVQSSTAMKKKKTALPFSLQHSVTANSIVLTLNPNASNSSQSARSDTATPVSYKNHGFSPTDLYSMVSHQFPHTGGHYPTQSISSQYKSTNSKSRSCSVKSRSDSAVLNESRKTVITPQKYQSK